jgi:DNA-nicking Smr family endonuclease
MNQDDIDAFRQAMRGVTPLRGSDRRAPSFTKRKPSLAERARRQAAGALPPADGNPLLLPETVPLRDPDAVDGMRKSGIQENVFRRLRLGQYEVEASLDLHRIPLKEACDQVHAFLEASHRNNLRCLMIVHGKGKNALMKSHVWYWLNQHSLVLAWHSATPRQGGAGATCVLIRRGRHTLPD